MAEQVQEDKCLAEGIQHRFEFVTAAHGYQCFKCALCGHTTDVVEDSQP